MVNTSTGFPPNRTRKRYAVSNSVMLALFAIIVIIVAGVAVLGYNFGSTQANQSLVNSLQSQVSTISNQLKSQGSNLSLVQAKLSSLPEENQKPQVRNIKVDWSNTENSGQDRFYVPTITVNQGDTIVITFVSNDTDAHTFTLESPYDFQINATVPGTLDYLKNETPFTTNATNNSPGVKVFGTPGNVTGTGSFVAKYAGIFEYFCIYHVALGMFGYLTVLPNEAYSNSYLSNSTAISGTVTPVSIASGAAANPNSSGFTPSVITVVIGVNNTIQWTNNDSVPHTVTADDGSFSSGNLNPSDEFTWTFTTAGNYAYHCSYHPWMKATIIVKSG